MFRASGVLVCKVAGRQGQNRIPKDQSCGHGQPGTRSRSWPWGSGTFPGDRSGLPAATPGISLKPLSRAKTGSQKICMFLKPSEFRPRIATGCAFAIQTPITHGFRPLLALPLVHKVFLLPGNMPAQVAQTRGRSDRRPKFCPRPPRSNHIKNQKWCATWLGICPGRSCSRP